MQSKYKVDYGATHSPNPGLVIQFYYPYGKLVQFLNWELDLIGENEAAYAVAVWRVKRLKRKAVIDIPPFITELN